MAINIKSPDCERLVRELADLTGDSITDAIQMAVRERLTREKLRTLGSVERSWQRIERIQERIRAFPVAERRDALTYDEWGLPR